jgi:hypothetical protein
MSNTRSKKPPVLTTVLVLGVILFVIARCAFAGTAFYQYDYTEGGNRFCVYDYLGSEYILTIPSYKWCPQTIEVD